MNLWARTGYRVVITAAEMTAQVFYDSALLVDLMQVNALGRFTLL